MQVVGEDGALLGRLFVTAGDFSDEADACVIKQGQSAYVSIRQHTYILLADDNLHELVLPQEVPRRLDHQRRVCVSIRQHTSAYVSI